MMAVAGRGLGQLRNQGLRKAQQHTGRMDELNLTLAAC
jgi:hypothetical protein